MPHLLCRLRSEPVGFPNAEKMSKFMIVSSALATAVLWPALTPGTTTDVAAAAVQVDAVAVVSAPEAVQVERVLKRPGMTEERLRSIMGWQVPDAEKRRRAQFVIDTVRPT